MPVIFATSFLDIVFLFLGLVMLAIPIYLTFKIVRTLITGQPPTRIFEDSKDKDKGNKENKE